MAENMSTANPYLGPRTFSRTDGDRFFGREREARDLFSLIASERLVLFYAQSGAGKSSLLNARIVPRLEKHGYIVLPVARVSGELPKGVSSVDNIFVYNLMIGMLADCSTPERFADMELKDFLAALVTDDGQSYRYDEVAASAGGDGGYEESYSVLIIDQFEEIITTHQDHWQEREDFFRQLNDAMLADPKLWVLLTLREDFVAALEPFAPLLTDKLRARFYMQRMTKAAALQAIKDPAALAGRPFTPDAAKTLVKNLMEIPGQQKDVTHLGQFVEPVQLQVVCYQLWENLQGQKTGPITQEDLAKSGDVDNSLSKFYEDAIAQVIKDSSVPVSALEIRNWFQDELITEAGTRGSVYQGATHTKGLDNSVVQLLSASFLLRSEQRAGGTWYELIHDRFINPILKSNQRWRDKQGEILQAAEAWKDDDKDPDKLYKGLKLLGAQRSYGGHMDSLEPLVRDFLQASKRKRRRRAFRNLLIVIAALFILGFWLIRVSESWDPFIPGIVFTPDGQHLVVTSDDVDNTVYLWNLEDLSEDPIPLFGHDLGAITADISPDGRWLATGGQDNAIHLWDLADLTRNSIILEGHEGSIRTLAFSPDGQLLASGSLDDSIHLWPLDEPGIPPEMLVHDDLVEVVQVSFSPDGSHLAATDRNKNVFIWDLDDLATGPQILIYGGLKDE